LVSLAILATNLFIDIPAEAVRPTSTKLFSNFFAKKLALGFPFLLTVIK
jgi:hypothetical protein